MGKKKKHEVMLPNEEELYIPQTKKLPYKVRLKYKNKKILDLKSHNILFSKSNK